MDLCIQLADSVLCAARGFSLGRLPLLPKQLQVLSVQHPAVPDQGQQVEADLVRTVLLYTPLNERLHFFQPIILQVTTAALPSHAKDKLESPGRWSRQLPLCMNRDG